MRGNVLHEQAGDVLAFGRQAGIDGRGDQHFNNGRCRPAELAGVEIGLLEIIERRADDDTGAVMLGSLGARPAGKIRQLGQRDVHAEGAGAALYRRKVRADFGRHGALWNEVAEQQLWRNV